jgi:hypothetical protein
MTMTTKSEFAVIEMPIYGGKILVCVAADPWVALRDAKLPRGGYRKKDSTTLEAWVEETKKPEIAPNGEKVRWIVALRDNCTLNTLAHECYHLTNFLAAWYGLTTDAGEDEAPAYIHGWLVDQVYAKLCAYHVEGTDADPAVEVPAADSVAG